MRKRSLFVLAGIFLLASSCHHHQTPPGDGPDFIPTDTANKMLSSYLNSIHYSTNDTDLHSVIMDANALRDFLNSDSGIHITKMKVMLAHTLTYANSPGRNTPCGYRSGKLTFILAGYNAAGNYIYLNNKVQDNGMPCPSNCPTVGNAKSDFLPHY